MPTFRHKNIFHQMYTHMNKCMNNLKMQFKHKLFKQSSIDALEPNQPEVKI
jgi:adenine C2-methylase RlmN of 23S rRNA A2503 and tRNA A37